MYIDRTSSGDYRDFLFFSYVECFCVQYLNNSYHQ